MSTHSLPIPAESARRRLRKTSVALLILLSVTASAGAERPSTLEDQVRRAALATYIHGMTEETAMSEVGVEGLPVLRRLLADRDFPRRDNVVAFLAFLGTTEDSHALLALLDAPPASLASPDEARAVLLAPQALGQIASRGEPVALEALLEMTAAGSRGGVLERTAAHATNPAAFRSNLLHMSLRGLAYAGGSETRSRLLGIARGRIEPAPGGPSLNSAAWSALDLRREMREPRTPPSETEPTDGGEDPPVEASTGSGVLDSQDRVHDSPLTYANHVDIADPMADSRLDAVLAEASLRAGRGDDPVDVACCVSVSRGGPALEFGTTGDGLDIIDDDPEMRTVLRESTARVKVITAINYCGGPGTNIIGCAWRPGNGMVVVRMSGLNHEAVLWIHEYGHNTGLTHNTQNNAFLMYGSDNGNNRLLTQAECDSFHSPSTSASMTPGDTGACTDFDADLVQDGLDNCPSVANYEQLDSDGDGVGDVCSGPGCGNDVREGDEACDGSDLGGDTCVSLGFAGGDLSCALDCAFDTSACTCTDADGDGVSACDGDCDDSDPASYPGAVEICDGADNDCDGTVDSGIDGDGDGVDDLCDNCPALDNGGQEDADDDGMGDACDPCPDDPDNDLDGDGVCGNLDGHPDDPDRTGPLHVGVADAVNDAWTTVTLPYVYQDPVVIAGPPSYNGQDPGVVQIRSVSSTSFEIRFAEWTYLDGTHWMTESVPYLVMEKGRYQLDDGSIWEADTFNLAGTHSFFFRRFSSVFDGPPHVVLSAQTVNDVQPVTIRARNVKADGFGAALSEEEALMDGHPTEEVGYVAVYSPLGSGRVTMDGSLRPYLLQSVPVDRNMTPVLGWNVRLHEDRSLDSEDWHTDETVAALVLGDRLFAQAISWEGSDPFSLRRMDPEPSASVAWGAVDHVDDGWTLVPLPRVFSNPVVVAKAPSRRDPASGTLRLRNVGSDTFEVRFEEWSYLNGTHSGERVFFLVAEAGQHDLGGLTFEAGTLTTNKTLGPGGWSQIGLNAAFSSAPAVFASVQTVNDADPVVTRVKQRSSSGFKLTMQEEEADGGGHATETLGWIVVEVGTATTTAGRKLEIVEATGSHLPTVVGFVQSFARRFPTMLADLASSNDEDTCGIRHIDIGRRDVTLIVEEEQSLDAEMDHGTEEICLFLAD